jgi:hypothetical protein
MPVEQVVGSENTFRVNVDHLDGGWSTRTYPTILPENKLSVADNVTFSRDGVVSKRPGNGYYGGGASSSIGTGLPVQSLFRFYAGVPRVGTLLAHSGTGLYKGNDATGAWSAIAAVTLSNANPAHFTQMYDSDMSSGAATACIITDGVHIPWAFDGTNAVPVHSTGGTFLPLGRAGSPITPLYGCNWAYHMCYAGQPDEPTALYISDALRPEAFTGINYIDSAISSYTAYYPAGRDGTLGVITGIISLGAYLLVFYTGGIVTGTNTGTYGGTQFVWTRLSNSIGCPSPRSIAAMEGAIFFFGGDRFYATDTQSITPLPDDIPSVYANNARSTLPAEIANSSTVVGVRRGLAYWASYNAGAGALSRIVVFDTAAAGGWSYTVATGTTQGGAWSRWLGMNLNCGIECRGPGDTTKFPMFWGSSISDTVAQHDIGTSSDFGLPITFEARTKSYYLDKPISKKTIQGAYLLCVFGISTTAQVFNLAAYAVEDATITPAPSVTLTLPVVGVLYGSGVLYGQGALYQAAAQSQLIPVKVYPAQIGPCTAVGIGLVEASTNAFSIIGFVFEVTIDPTAP